MVGLAFLGGLISTGIAIAVLYIYVRRRIRKFSSEVFGNDDILEALAEIDTLAENTPRSLSGCDTLLLPQIMKDFPDFDPVMAKTIIRKMLDAQFGEQEAFTIHNVVISRYLPYEVQKTIVFQAAVSWKETGQILQKRYALNYSYVVESSSESVAANCPNCGGALGYGQTQCSYCGSRVSQVIANCWEVTEIKEC